MSLIRGILRRYGYMKVGYGFSCGRHWLEIDGKVIAQTSGDDVRVMDEEIEAIQVALFGATDERGRQR